MKRLFFVAGLLSAGAAHGAEDEIAATCEARELMNIAGCVCLQTLATQNFARAFTGLSQNTCNYPAPLRLSCDGDSRFG